ncbi:hypothetical protein CEE34_01545 [Candidatus Aerophobetes bacterium Ae_b3a]|nr:MAG: hypothetical protein CEE34_01545 [Candidatus Aerophobetes bacterium Ae_b3a]
MANKQKQTRIYENAIKNWPEDERPREKLFKAGEHTLSNTDMSSGTFFMARIGPFITAEEGVRNQT